MKNFRRIFPMSIFAAITASITTLTSSVGASSLETPHEMCSIDAVECLRKSILNAVFQWHAFKEATGRYLRRDVGQFGLPMPGTLALPGVGRCALHLGEFTHEGFEILGVAIFYVL